MPELRCVFIRSLRSRLSFFRNFDYNQKTMRRILYLFVFLLCSVISFAQEESANARKPKDESKADEMLYGNFESQKWFVQTDDDAVWRKREQNGVFRFELKKSGKISWIPLFLSVGHTFEAGKTYTFSIKAKADKPTELKVSIKRNEGDYGNLGFSDKMALTTEWKTFTFTFVPKETSKNARLDIGSFKEGTIYAFTGATLKPGGNAAISPTRSP
jgi:hypothetical protein